MRQDAVGAARWHSRIALLAALVLAVPAAFVPIGPAGATEPPGPPPLAGIDFIDAWSNDDGGVDGGDGGDIGDVNPVFDNHGTASSDDPAAAGLDPVRVGKDVARCTAAVRSGDAGFVDVVVDTAYPGYVCTFRVTFENGTGVPATVAPTVILYDDGLTVTDVTAPPLPDLLGPGETASAVYSARIEQAAPQDATLAFSIVVAFTGDDDQQCVPLDPADIPDGAVLVNNSGLCTYFYDGKPGDCGPGWTEEDPFAWHFVANGTRNLGDGSLAAVFLSGLTVTGESPVKVNRNNQHFYVYTPTADTLVGAYVVFAGADPARLDRVNLVLSHTCNDPVAGGHTGGADLGLSLAGTGSDDGTSVVSVSLANDGIAAATDVVVSPSFPAGVTLTTITAPRGTEILGDGSWLVPWLGLGDTVVATYAATAGTPGSYVVTAEVTGSGVLDVDSTPANGAAGEDDFAAIEVRLGLPLDAPEGGAAAALIAAMLLGAAAYLARRRPLAPTAV
jgi:hypothetical protein